jgi:hypothetical protein
MTRPTLEVADILRASGGRAKHLSWYWKTSCAANFHSTSSSPSLRVSLAATHFTLYATALVANVGASYGSSSAPKFGRLAGFPSSRGTKGPPAPMSP